MTPAEFKAARENLGMTQTELAEEWGVNSMTISRYETGARKVPPLAVWALKAMLKGA